MPKKQQNKWSRVPVIDSVDRIIIYLIGSGGNTTTFLANSLGLTNSCITERTRKLTKNGYLLDNHEAYTKRKYQLSKQGQEFLTKVNIFSTILHLQSYKK